jgi:hypothetical protein
VQQQAKEKKRSTDVCKAAAVDFGVQSDKRKDRAKCWLPLSQTTTQRAAATASQNPIQFHTY